MPAMTLNKARWLQRTRTVAFCFLAVLVAVSLGMLFTARTAHAKTFTVDSTANPGTSGR